MQEPLDAEASRLKEEEVWKPSNGNDACYMEEICCTCQHDAAFQAGIGYSCEIAAAMYLNMGDPAWVIGKNGPYCKQFKAIGDTAYRCDKTPDFFSSSEA